MQRRIKTNNRTALFIERLVWNAAAGAALAVMILVLLGSLRWLDRIAPQGGGERPSASAEGTPRASLHAPDRPAEVARVGRPAG